MRELPDDLEENEALLVAIRSLVYEGPAEGPACTPFCRLCGCAPLSCMLFFQRLPRTSRTRATNASSWASLDTRMPVAITLKPSINIARIKR